MKKILAAFLALAMLLSLAACKKTEADDTVISEQPETEQSDTVSGDPAEYSREFWEAKYPGENLCPFQIEENGKEYSYYWISGLDGWNGTIEGWLNQPFNWNGWHKTDDGCIVNKNETLKITDDWANGDESMSSFCTVTTEKYNKSGNGSTAASSNQSTPATASNAPELAIKNQEELVCIKNERFVAKYKGDHSDDSAFFDDLGEDALYYVWNGFLDDGSINQIKGYTCLYYFFKDEASYRDALSKVTKSSVRKQNDECLYFTVITATPDDDNYDDMMNTFGNGEDYRHPQFYPVG